MAWNKPKAAMEIRYATKKFGLKNAKASVMVIRAMKMFHMPLWAYCVQMRTTVFESSMSASFLVRSMFFLMYSTARYAPVTTACMEAPENQKTTDPPQMKPSKMGA